MMQFFIPSVKQNVMHSMPHLSDIFMAADMILNCKLFVSA